ncbi:MAG: EamA family transporter [Micavibrio aeruginosavorus]|nr:EamA family transporter [Micavibrio aeruginosavorus]
MPVRDILLALLVVILWGGNVVAIKIGVTELPALVILALRFSMTALVFLPFIRIPPRSQWRLLFEVSFYMCVVHQGLLFVGLHYLDASTAVILLQSQILFATLLGWMVLRETIHWRTAAGLAIGFFGILLTFGAPDLRQHPAGFILLMLSALAIAFSYIRMRQLKNIHPMTFIVATNGLAAPLIFIASLFLTKDGWAQLPEADWLRAGGVLAYQILLISLSHILWQALLARNPVATVASFVLLMPIVAILLSAALLHETLSPALIWGGILTLAGVGIITVRKIQKRLPMEADPAM